MAVFTQGVLPEHTCSLFLGPFPIVTSLPSSTPKLSLPFPVFLLQGVLVYITLIEIVSLLLVLASDFCEWIFICLVQVHKFFSKDSLGFYVNASFFLH